MLTTRIVLASASPRRAELLRLAGIEFDVLASAADETHRAGEAPEAYVRRVAEAKAVDVARRTPARIVLAADTTVVVEDQVLGKPADAADAAGMLRMLSGRAHRVMTGVTVIVPADGMRLAAERESGTTYDTSPGTPEAGTIRMESAVAVTTVEFAPLSDQEIAWYVSTGEPLDKAGAYAVQGLASRFVTRLDGSYSNVVGLPVALVYRMLNSEHKRAAAPGSAVDFLASASD